MSTETTNKQKTINEILDKYTTLELLEELKKRGIGAIEMETIIKNKKKQF